MTHGRYLIYRSATALNFLCVCSAISRGHALKIARRMFRLERTAEITGVERSGTSALID
jgi:hypothetical protein